LGQGPLFEFFSQFVEVLIDAAVVLGEPETSEFVSIIKVGVGPNFAVEVLHMVEDVVEELVRKPAAS
jgi:hypothetical protein